MNGLQRFWFGGSGALLPLLITLVGADLAVLIDQHEQLTQGMIIGASIRYMSLFILGGIVASLHTDEKSPLKLVQLGIAAPALITSYISVGAVNASGSLAFQMPSVVGSAYASDTAPNHNFPRGEFIVASEFLNDVFKGWSKPLDRTVKRTSRKPATVKSKKSVGTNWSKQLASEPPRAMGDSASPAPITKPTLDKQKQKLLKEKMKIEQELKRLDKLRK